LSITEIKRAKVVKYADKKLVLINDEGVVRVRLYGTVIKKFVTSSPKSKDPKVKKYASVVLVDSGGVITLRCWQYGMEPNQAMNTLEKINRGDILDVIGRIKDYDEELYVMPELVKDVGIEFELFRRLQRLQGTNLVMEYQGEKLTIPV
jgi:RPA family protein